MTAYTAEMPLPWCAVCRAHHVLRVGDACPLCEPHVTGPVATPSPARDLNRVRDSITDINLQGA